VNVVETLSIVDYGDVPVSPGDTERTYGQVEEALTPLVDAGVFPLALGGDHSVTLAELRVLARGGTDRLRSSSSTPTVTRGTSTSVSATSTARPSCGPPRRR
jgi:hypothetical protein